MRFQVGICTESGWVDGRLGEFLYKFYAGIGLAVAMTFPLLSSSAGFFFVVRGSIERGQIPYGANA